MSIEALATPQYPTSPPKDVPAKMMRIWRCNFCASGVHASCPGAVRNGTKQLILCYCCRNPPRCLDCGMSRPDEVNPETWSCLDKSGCEGRIAARLTQAPLWNMLQQCKVSSTNTRRSRRLVAAALKEAIGPEVDEFDRPIVRPPRQPRPSAGVCECCGSPTKGGKFLPGHDARMKSRLRTAAKAGDGTAQAELNKRGW